MSRWPRDWQWLAWTLAGALATGVYFLLPAETLGTSMVYNGIGFVSSLVIVLGVRRWRPARPAMWYWFAAGNALWSMADVVYSYYKFVLFQEPFPSFADVLYVSAYPLLIAGLYVVVRGRTKQRDPAGLVDALIIATGTGLVFWTFVMSPVAQDASIPVTHRVISLAYPAADVILLALTTRLLTGAGARSPSFRLLIMALLLLLGADIAYSVVSSYGNYTGGIFDAGWLLSYVLWAAAALHPSMRQLSDESTARPAGFTRLRAVLLAVSSLLAPLLLLMQGVTRDGQVDWPAIGLCAVALFLLVVSRMFGLVKQVQSQANQLRDQVMHDDLTGLPNRRLVEQRVGDALRRHQLVQIALIDLDDFKGINDRLGHAIGDRLLAAVGERLAGLLRPTDTVARLGGDEFAILMPDTLPETADAIVAEIVAALEQPVTAGEHHLLVRASVGLADGSGTIDPFELLRRVDVAMYAAKETGGRQLRYTPEMDERATEHARLGANLRVALDTGQFQLVYQPIVTLPHGRTVGVEALIRWQHPTLGSISPAEFIPVAERNGLIVELGAWILLEACSQAAHWRRKLGPAAPRKVSVNVSARQLAEPDFADVVAAVLAVTGLPAEHLTIEVTETAVFGGGRALKALHAVHALGVQIALDDFGTGHSSLGLLQTVPVDVLKVDKSFVDNITMAGRHAVIATALINVSNGLNLLAVAEGVETAEQADELFRLGYRFAQGYHFGRPVAQPNFTATVEPAVPVI